MANLGRPKILLVEDDEAILALLKQVLDLGDYHIDCAVHGQEAFDYLKTHKPDLILMDLMMPVMGGLEFRKLQLKDPTIAKIPVILMTADSELSQETKDFRPQYFLKKPLSIDDVLEKVRVALNANLK